MSDLTSAIFAQIDQGHIESIAGQLGIDPAQASDAIQQALPLLMGGLARNATSPQGANALHSALERDHDSVDIGGLLGSVLGGGGNRRGGGVLVEVAGLQPGAVHPRDARGVEGRKVGAGETAPILENSVRQAQAMRQQQAFAFRQREFAEDHAPVSTRSPR